LGGKLETKAELPSVGSFLRTTSGRLAGITFFLTLFYTLWVFGFTPSESFEPFVSSSLLVASYIVFVILAIGLSRDERLGSRGRQGWLFLALANLSTAIAEVIWFYYESILNQDAFVSAGDVFFLLSYPLILAGVMRFPYASRTREERTTLYLDLTIVATASFMALSYFVLSPEYFTPDEAMEAVIGISYPVGGVLILTAVMALLQSSAEKATWWTLFFLGSGIFSNALADGFMAYFEVHDVVYDLTRLNILWMTGSLFMIVAAAWQHTVGEPLPPVTVRQEISSRRYFRQSLPYAATLTGIAVLFLAVRQRGAASIEILTEAGVLISLVLLRQHRTIRENVRLYKDMERLAITDSLTGVYNRHFANETLRLQFWRSKRYSVPLSILMIDVNGFKQFNDRFGHLKGDEVLRSIAQALVSSVRSSDLLGRFGGDEFIAILPETDYNGAAIVAEKICRSIALKEFQGYKLGVSIGISSIDNKPTQNQMLEDADRDLYRKKDQKQRKY